MITALQLVLSLAEAIYAIVGSIATICVTLLLLYSLHTYSRELRLKLKNKSTLEK